jgi:hypothetical protein
MAPDPHFNVLDPQPRDVFIDNNPVAQNRTYWIVRTREGDRVMLDSYDPNNNSDTGYAVSKTLNDLNNYYTYLRRNPVDPLGGGRKRKRRSLKSRKSKRRKSIKKRSRKY